nr:glycosyltransferase family 1 protein [Mucilaginibacter sp. L294]
MKILFDHQAFSNQNYGGISRYFANLYQGLNDMPGTEAELGLLLTHNTYIDKKELPLGGVLNTVIRKRSRRDKYNKWYCRYLLKQNHFDVFHPTYYNPYFLKTLTKPFVVTVHDMIHESFPHYFEKVDPYTIGYKKQAITQASHIIAISAATKNDILKFYDIAEDKITVVHHGFKMQQSVSVPVIEAPKRNYLLFVGDRFGYKNFEMFIKAVSPLLLKRGLGLVCAGGGGFNASETELIKKYNIADRVSLLTVNDDELNRLYTNALAFVYPSLFEGFGLPILEAFHNNCPVIMSNTSSLPEVGGDAALYFDPTNEQSIIAAVEQLIDNITLQNELKVKGQKRLKQFSFDQCINNTIQVYKHVLKSL